MELERIFDGTVLTAEEVLQSRTDRRQRQREFLKLGHPCLISFTMNIPGAVKQFSLAHAAFQVELELLRQELCGHIIDQNLTESTSGNEALICVDLPPKQVKQCTVALEEYRPLGRLFDIDVLDHEGVSISRIALGLPLRRCLLCGKNAKLCGRSQAHSLEAVRFVVAQLLTDFFCNQAADRCAACATRALLYEVSTTPKPRLVDRANSGSHKDMNFFTFLDSSAALSPWFREFFCIGWANARQQASTLFFRLRLAGKQAEQAMFSATKGVNTHKGLIFSLGILCGALGAVHSENPFPLPRERVFQLCQELGQCALSDFNANNIPESNGLWCFRIHQVAGVRGEAAQGFPTIRNIGLPSLRRRTAQGFSLNDAGAMTLIALLANTTDTNMIHRGGVKTARKCQNQAQELLNQIDKDDLYPRLSALDQQYIKENLSPGGCADLLALSLMIFFLEQEGYLSL